MSISGKTALLKAVESKIVTGQRLKIFEVYCEMHDKYDWARERGVTTNELIDYIKVFRSDVAKLFLNLTHVNKHISTLRRYGVIREWGSRPCSARDEKIISKANILTGEKPVPLPAHVTAAQSLRKIREKVEYMEKSYYFKDEELRYDFRHLKELVSQGELNDQRNIKKIL